MHDHIIIRIPASTTMGSLKALADDIPLGSEIFRIPVADDWGL